ncbi:ROK family protein [Neobacillus kokaensis]|uniref:Glucokinase n=1 Tax=Neobacillus kokaensis TaxID=2759023 RepID=A0ABQ3MZC8_9BACI|nr:ROK family protein [Neobacillus kokaensis]GHH97787.1 glucokinase [Neobacillus kokaensis]
MLPMTNKKFRQNYDQKYGVGVDIGGTKIFICIADMRGNVVFKQKVKTTSDYDQIYRYIYESVKAAGLTLDQVASIGFGVPGITNSLSGMIIDAPAFKWKNVPFKKKMQQYFDCSISVNNDVNCAAQGERWIGSAKKIEDFVFIAIGTGVGSAIFSNGAMVQGDQFMAGEIGYLLGDGDLPQAHTNLFGEFGIFEQKTSGTALSRHGYDPKVLFQSYKMDEPDAVRIVNQFVTDLAIAISNIVSLLNPRKVIIGGGVAASMSVILEVLRLKVSQFTPIPVSIELSTLDEESGAIGALAFAFEQTGLLEAAAIPELYENKLESR